jgi:hypothetical protein
MLLAEINSPLQIDDVVAKLQQSQLARRLK